MGPLYLILVTAAGLRYIQLSIQALTEADEEAWGKKMFFFSIKYLGVVFLALPLDVLIPQPFGYDIGMRADSIALLSEAAQPAARAHRSLMRSLIIGTMRERPRPHTE